MLDDNDPVFNAIADRLKFSDHWVRTELDVRTVTPNGDGVLSVKVVMHNAGGLAFGYVQTLDGSKNADSVFKTTIFHVPSKAAFLTIFADLNTAAGITLLLAKLADWQDVTDVQQFIHDNYWIKIAIAALIGKHYALTLPNTANARTIRRLLADGPNGTIKNMRTQGNA